MNSIHLQLDHLAVGYHRKVLIRGIEIGVERAEIVTLIGPNGSGKSTILKTIARQIAPVDGDILLAGDREAHSSLRALGQYEPGELARQMAVMLTGRLQTELMTCRDVAAMGRYPYTGRFGILSEADERKVEEALAAVHAQHLADRPFDTLSDGERQRVLLARAICQEPKIIVLDEPTSFLDIRHKLELLDILYRMSREQGITVVMSMHEIDLAMKISDRILCVKGEEIFACGKPSEILDDGTVRELYDLDPKLGHFDVRRGSLALSFAGGADAAGDTGSAGEGSTDPAGAGSEEALSIPRFMLTAPASGSGKTLITCGLLRLLERNRLRPAAFKCGPDYIDPMFHRQVLGLPSRNLDTFFSPADSQVSGNTTKEILARSVRACGAEVAVIEGVMGYYDGTGESGMEASSCELARQTETPVILIVNARGMGRSVVPLIRGFADYENGERRIRGVILNRVSAGMYPRMKKWIEEDSPLKVIGYLPQDDGLSWKSRHLGLLQPEEVKDLQGQIDHLADVLEKTIDLEALLRIAHSAPPVQAPEDRLEAAVHSKAAPRKAVDENVRGDGHETAPRIAVARDEAFRFYYEDNLDLLTELGAELVFFSPIHDRKVPRADGLLLGGGYPELFARALADNESMKADIRRCAAAGMPILAECGGFMYLQERLEIPGEKPEYEMCGVLPGTCRMEDRLVRFGYLELSGKGEAGYLADGHRIRGHEFHYFDSTDNGAACTAKKPGTARAWDCMAVQGSIMAGFPHLYYRSDPEFAGAFVERCRQFGARTQERRECIWDCTGCKTE